MDCRDSGASSLLTRGVTHSPSTAAPSSTAINVLHSGISIIRVTCMTIISRQSRPAILALSLNGRLPDGGWIRRYTDHDVAADLLGQGLLGEAAGLPPREFVGPCLGSPVLHIFGL